MAAPTDYRAGFFERYRTAWGWTVPTSAAVSRWGRAYRTYLRGWLPSSRSARIIDVACGPGFLLQFLSTLGYQDVSGVDLSLEQVEVARQHCPNVALGDAVGYLAARPGAYDVIFALDFIEHLKREEAMEFLATARSALAPGGRLVLQTPNCATPWGAGQRYADFTHEIGLTPGSLDAILRLAGFVSVEFREARPVPYGVKSVVRFAAWQVLRQLAIAYDFIETGSRQPVYTRVFFASAVTAKPSP